jgi:hypothetical protein
MKNISNENVKRQTKSKFFIDKNLDYLENGKSTNDTKDNKLTNKSIKKKFIFDREIDDKFIHN